MFGIGDCLHQRAVIRRLVEDYDVWLETCHVWMHLDLMERGNLHLVLRPTTLWMHVQNINREQTLHPGVYRPVTSIPKHARTVRNWYLKKEIDKTGSILATMFHSSGVDMRVPDFTLRIRDEWRTNRVRDLLATARISGKPLMIYRPVVLRKEWDGKQRNPDPQAYAALYEAVRRDYFTISIASLRPNVEWIVGNEQDADMKIHGGQLEMWEMAALFAGADVVFCNAGMAPVLAQAVGTPSVVVYGGRESYKTTQREGAHQAPTLGIDTINPCDCHSHHHNCEKQIDVGAALPRLHAFLDGLRDRGVACAS